MDSTLNVDQLKDPIFVEEKEICVICSGCVGSWVRGQCSFSLYFRLVVWTHCGPLGNYWRVGRFNIGPRLPRFGPAKLRVDRLPFRNFQTCAGKYVLPSGDPLGISKTENICSKSSKRPLFSRLGIYAAPSRAKPIKRIQTEAITPRLEAANMVQSGPVWSTPRLSHCPNWKLRKRLPPARHPKSYPEATDWIIGSCARVVMRVTTGVFKLIVKLLFFQ